MRLPFARQSATMKKTRKETRMSDTLKKTLNLTAVLHAVGFILLELYLLLASLPPRPSIISATVASVRPFSSIVPGAARPVLSWRFSRDIRSFHSSITRLSFSRHSSFCGRTSGFSSPASPATRQNSNAFTPRFFGSSPSSPCCMRFSVPSSRTPSASTLWAT